MPSIPTPDDFARALERHPRLELPALPGRTNHLRSGVLVPLVWCPDPICVVTVRSLDLRQHAGEICFPGGRPDDGDRDLRETALREAREEIGIEQARVLGELSSIPLYTSDYRLHPFVAEVADGPFRINPSEVSAVLRIPLREALAHEQVEAIPWSHEGTKGLSPVFRLEGRIMYGATAHSFYELLVLAAPLFGCAAPPLRAGSLSWSDVLR